MAGWYKDGASGCEEKTRACCSCGRAAEIAPGSVATTIPAESGTQNSAGSAPQTPRQRTRRVRVARLACMTA